MVYTFKSLKTPKQISKNKSKMQHTNEENNVAEVSKVYFIVFTTIIFIRTTLIFLLKETGNNQGRVENVYTEHCLTPEYTRKEHEHVRTQICCYTTAINPSVSRALATRQVYSSNYLFLTKDILSLE